MAQRIHEAALLGAASPEAYKFQVGAAAFFLTNESSFESSEETEPPVRIHTDRVTIGSNAVSLESPPELVIEYGACLDGRYRIDDQAGFTTSGTRPFAYAPLTSLRFVTTVLAGSYELYGDGLMAAAFTSERYLGNHDGVAPGLSALIERQAEYPPSLPHADIILCDSTGHITGNEVFKGIVAAPDLLKVGGKLIVQACVEPAEREIGVRDISTWAYEAGFQPEGTSVYDVVSAHTDRLRPSGTISLTQTMVFTRPNDLAVR